MYTKDEWRKILANRDAKFDLFKSYLEKHFFKKVILIPEWSNIVVIAEFITEFRNDINHPVALKIEMPYRCFNSNSFDDLKLLQESVNSLKVRGNSGIFSNYIIKREKRNKKRIDLRTIVKSEILFALTALENLK